MIVHDWKWKSIVRDIRAFQIKYSIPASEEIHATEILIEHQRAIPLEGRETRLQSTHYSRIGFILTYAFSICGKLPFDIYSSSELLIQAIMKGSRSLHNYCVSSGTVYFE